MKIGRNDPCPCGSGRKYKRCCLPLEEGAGLVEGGSGPAIRAAVRVAPDWQADLVPLPVSFGDDPAARPGAVLVTAAGLVVHTNVLGRPPAEPEEVAAELARELLEAREQLGASPDRILVRHLEVARSLSRLLAEAGWKLPVQVGPLEDLDEASLALRSSMSGEPVDAAPTASPLTWAGWGLPESWCADLFRGAASFYRAAPWEHLFNVDALELTMPDGRTWTATVLGNAGQEFGLVLYADRADVDRILDAEPNAATDVLRGPTLSLLLARASEISREMRREVMRAGWEIAAADAYPLLITINTLAGGIRRRDADDLVASLAAVAAFAETHREALEKTIEEIVFRHDETGVTVRLEARGEIPPAEALRPGGPEGPGARPAAALDDRLVQDPEAFEDREMEAVRGFERSLRDKGLSEATVQRHATNAAHLVHFLVGYQAVPLAAIDEFDLRVFLGDWFPRKSGATLTEARALPTSLNRFFGYLSAAHGLHLPWADGLLADREGLEERFRSFPGGFWWDREVTLWRAPLWLDLDARLMVHDLGLGEDDRWGETMGIVEARLDHELQRRWLLWRNELLRDTPLSVELLAERLRERQRAWETAPHPEHGGKSPIEAIAEERRRREAVTAGPRQRETVAGTRGESGAATDLDDGAIKGDDASDEDDPLDTDDARQAQGDGEDWEDDDDWDDDPDDDDWEENEALDESDGAMVPGGGEHGQCALCGERFTRRGMSRHLTACLPKHDERPGKRRELLHLRVESRGPHWLDIEVAADARLQDLDAFLRGIWLECCGHMSAFDFDPMARAGHLEDVFDERDPRGGMRRLLGELVSQGQRFAYEYDFGSTTRLGLRVVGSRRGAGGEEAVRLLARNDPPTYRCDVCSEPSVWICPFCSDEWDTSAWGTFFCEAHGPEHPCVETLDELMPVVNSPRMGVCGYTGDPSDWPEEEPLA